MFTGKNKLEAILEPHFASDANKVRLFVLILLSVLMFLPTLSQADGLFDFQMKLAQKGNAEAQFKVGEMYETGFGVKQDMSEAMSWITKAYEQGHDTAGFKLLYWDVEKNNITEANKAQVEALKALAKEGNGQAQYYIGKMYAHGVGMKKNSNEAISWLNKAALLGVLEAEREVVLVREDRQRQVLAKRRADEKKRAAQKVQQERERKARLEQQRAKHEAQLKLQQQKSLEAKALADEASRQNKAAIDARVKAEKEAAEKAKMLAQKEAEDKQREAQKQALLKKREADQQQRKTQFESDPCSGKSARFLSTCK